MESWVTLTELSRRRREHDVDGGDVGGGLTALIWGHSMSVRSVVSCSLTEQALFRMKPTGNTIEMLAQLCRYIETQSALDALNSILGKAAFVNRQTMGSLLRHWGWFSPFKWGTRYLAFSLCLVWGQTFFLKAFLNMSRGGNTTQVRERAPLIAQEYFAVLLPSAEISKSRLRLCVCCPERWLQTRSVTWRGGRRAQMWLRRSSEPEWDKFIPASLFCLWDKTAALNFLNSPCPDKTEHLTPEMSPWDKQDLKPQEDV